MIRSDIVHPDWHDTGSFKLLNEYKCSFCEKNKQEGKEQKEAFRSVMLFATASDGSGPTADDYCRLVRDFRDHQLKEHPESVPNRDAFVLAALKKQEQEKDKTKREKTRKRQRVDKRAERLYNMSAALHPFHHRDRDSDADTDVDL